MERKWNRNASNGNYYLYLGKVRVGVVAYDATTPQSLPSKFRATCRLPRVGEEQTIGLYFTPKLAMGAVDRVVDRWLEDAGLSEAIKLYDEYEKVNGIQVKKCTVCNGTIPNILGPDQHEDEELCSCE